MKKIALPLVMIASLTTLVSCWDNQSVSTPTISPKSPVVTGVVITPTQSGATTSTGISTVVSPSITTQTPVALTGSNSMSIDRSETVSYQSPGGLDQMDIWVVITDGIIASVTVTPKWSNDTSTQYQKGFAAEVAKKVVGKNAKSLQLSAIAGASLTTAAFEKFVQSI